MDEVVVESRAGSNGSDETPKTANVKMSITS